jgi:predicted small lipoprotein YifL
MKRLIIAFAALSAMAGCGESGPTYEQATAVYQDELAILEKLQNDRQQLLSDHREAIKGATPDTIADVSKSSSASLDALDAKIAAQQASVDKAEAARDAIR